MIPCEIVCTRAQSQNMTPRAKTVFENGCPRNISAKFSWNSPNTFREDDFTPHKSTTCRCQQLVVVFKQIKISLTIFEKVQPRNISEIISKSDQPFQWRRNKKFFLSPCSANKSSQPEPWLYTNNNFVNSFWKGSRKEYFCETILKFISDFREEEFFSSFPYSASSPFITAMFLEVSKFREEIFKRVIQGTYLWNYFEIWPAVWFFNNFFMSVRCK